MRSSSSSCRLRRFAIELLHDAEEFSPGDAISGAVIIEPTSTQVIGKLRVGIHGAAKVFWIKGISARNTSQYQHTKHINDSVDYFHVERSVFENRRASAPSGPSDYRPRLLGLTGPEEFPFVFKLPERGFPASWKGPHGSVQYWIDAVAEVGGNECFRENIVHPFRVISSPASAALPEPKLMTQRFPVASVACIPSAISVEARALRNYYAPGEDLTMKIKIRNASPWQISAKLSLIQNQIYVAHKGLTKHIRDVLAETDLGAIHAHSDIETECESLPIPRSCVSSLLNCKIIRNEYSAELHIKARKYFAEHFEVSVPILIYSPTSVSPSGSLSSPKGYQMEGYDRGLRVHRDDKENEISRESSGIFIGIEPRIENTHAVPG